MTDTIDRKKIEDLLPHRAPMLLIDKLINIVHLKSATAIMYVKKKSHVFLREHSHYYCEIRDVEFKCFFFLKKWITHFT